MKWYNSQTFTSCMHILFTLFMQHSEIILNILSPCMNDFNFSFESICS